MGQADVSSYIMRQSDNTFNPDNYDYILVPKDNETMSQHDISAPSISDLSNKNKLRNFQSHAATAMQEWMN
jgi:hypothetical protein